MAGLESTMICLDSSDWMRNGDYAPSRIEAQQDAASLICTDRTRGNPENTVGILSMGGKGVELLTSPTEDVSKILAALAKINIGGITDFSTAVQVAQLALKHRKNKNGGQRIILFVGSPLQEDVAALQKIGKQLKKNNVCIDVINMGDHDDNAEKLLEFVKAANSNDNSHLITIPAGVLPLDAISGSPVMMGNFHMGGIDGSGMGSGTGAGGGSGGGGGGVFEEYGGIDPSMDPELAMAIRVSTEEARAREEARTQAALQGSSSDTTLAQTSSSGTTSSSTTGYDYSSSSSSSSSSRFDAMDEEDEEVLMQRALALSMLDATPTSSTSTATVGGIANTSAPTATDTSAMSDTSTNILDPAFVNQLLQSSDLDMNDPLIQAALAQLGSGASATTTTTQPPPGAKDGTNDDDDDDDANVKKRKNEDS